MKATNNAISLLILLAIISTSLMSFRSEESIQAAETIQETAANNALKPLAFQVLKTKCSGCHKKQRPNLIFNLRNYGQAGRKDQSHGLYRETHAQGQWIQSHSGSVRSLEAVAQC